MNLDCYNTWNDGFRDNKKKNNFKTKIEQTL